MRFKDENGTLVEMSRSAQRVPEGHEDQQPIANRVATFAGTGHQLVDLWFREVFALPIFGVLCPTNANCRLFRLRAPQWDDRVRWQIPP
jgi:hypothetical protein